MLTILQTPATMPITLLLLGMLLKAIYLSRSDDCDCDYWKSLDGLSNFLYDVSNHLLKEFQTVYVFEKNCTMDRTIRFLHEVNIATVFYSLANDFFLLQNLISSLSVFGGTPVYVVLMICLSPKTVDKIIEISRSASSIPLVRWLFINPKDSLRDIRYGCKTGIVSTDKESQVFEVRGPLLITHNCTNIYRLAKWSSSVGIHSNSLVGLLDNVNKKELQGKKLVVSRLNVYPFFANEEDHSLVAGTNRKYVGIDYALLRTLSEHFRFSFLVETNPDGQWGYKVNDTYWKGMIGRVYHQYADLAMTVLSRTAEREEVVDFSYPHYLDAVSFVVRSPKIKSRGIILLQPLSSEIYIAVIVSIVVTSLAVGIICYWDHRCVGWTVLNAMWYFSGAITLQGGTIVVPSSSKVKIIVLAWWILCIVIMTGYSGKLISFLNIPIVNEAVDTVPQLIHALSKGTYKAGTVDGTSMLNNFMKAKEGDFYIIGRHMVQDPTATIMDNITIGMENVFDRRYAFIFPKGPMEAVAAKRGLDNFVFSKDRFYTTYYAIALRKGTPLKKIFKIPIIRLIEGGLIQKWHKDLLIKESIIGAFEQTRVVSEYKPRSFVLEDMRGSLFLLAIGYLVATIALILEKIAYKFQRSAAFENENGQTTKRFC